MTRIDAAVHVWSDDAASYPWSPLGGQAVPDHPATVDQLFHELRQARIDGAVCIQPRVYGYDHRFLSAVIASHPGRCTGVCLVDPTSPEGPAQLRRLVGEHHFSGARLLPFSEPTAEWLAGSSGDRLWEEAVAHRIPMDVLARPEQLSDLAARARRHPEIVVVIDHLAMVVPAEDRSGVRALLACADVPNLYVKMSAFGFLTRAPWPYEDIHPLLRQTFGAFGATRVIFGTDWPNTRAYGPYPRLVQLVDQVLDFDDASRALVLGGNAARVWSITTACEGRGGED